MSTLLSLPVKSIYVSHYSKGAMQSSLFSCIHRMPEEPFFFFLVFFESSSSPKFIVPSSSVFLSLLLCRFFFLFLLRMIFGGEHIVVSYTVSKTNKRGWGDDDGEEDREKMQLLIFNF